MPTQLRSTVAVLSRRMRIDLLIRAVCMLAGLWVFSFMIASVHAQGQDGSSESQLQTLLSIYQAKQAGLLQERQALLASGATPEQWQAWRQQNAQRFAAQQRRARTMALLSAIRPRPQPGTALIPAEASPTRAATLTTQATLANARAQIHNQLVQALPANATADQISQLFQQERQWVEQQHGAELDLLPQLAQALANESSVRVVPMPPPLQIPVDATPQMSAYLITRDQLMRAGTQLRNQYAAADPATRQAALQAWRQQNASALQQLQREAQALAGNN